MNNICKRKILIFLILCSVLLFIPFNNIFAYNISSGSCGDNTRYTLTSEGLLTISGIGPMRNYTATNSSSSDQPPWWNYTSQIKEIVVEEGVTSIGDLAFNGCNNLQTLTIPDGITYIGRSSFSSCFKQPTSIVIPDSVTTIEKQAFSGSNISNISLPPTLKTIKDSTFDNCSYLTTIMLPDGLTTIEKSSFMFCERLKSIYIPGSVTSIATSAFEGISSTYKIYTVPDSYVATHFPETHVEYLCEKKEEKSSTILLFKKDSIVFSTENVLSLNDYILTSIDIEDLEITISDTTCFMYDDGKIAKLKNGEATITVSYDNYSTEATLIAQDDYPEVTDISLNENNITLNIGDSYVNTLSFVPYNANSNSISWESTNTNVATVDNGIVTAVGGGTTIITVTVNHSIFKQYEVQVQRPLNDIALIDTNVRIKKGEKSYLFFKYPSDATDTITYSCSNPNIAIIDESGRIYANNNGSTNITIHSDQLSKTVTVTVYTPPNNIYLNTTEAHLKKGETLQLITSYDPEDTTEKTLTWSSNNENIATVNQNGLVTVTGVGTAIITAEGSGKKANCTINSVFPLASLSLDRTSAQVFFGESLQLNAVYEPEYTTDALTWSSSKESVAIVDENGLVTAQGMGIATITVSGGGLSADCNIICPEVTMTGISMDESKELIYGESYTAEVTYIPANTTDDKTVTWASSNESVISVSAEGKVTAVGVGNVTLTATVGEFTAETSITVVKAVPEYSIPTGITATCNHKLSDIKLTSGFNWKDDSANVGSAGTKTFKATYTPDDMNNYEIVEDIEIEVTVSHEYGGWIMNETSHWKECDCGEKSDEAEHTYGDWEVTKDTTCTEEGERKRVCSVCGYTQKESVEALGHNWSDEYTIDTKPTCTETGVKSIHCTRCGESNPETEEIIKATGHTWNTEYTIDKEATYTEEGLKSIHCSVCDAKDEDSVIVIPKLECIPISKAKISSLSNRVYTGKTMTPAVTVKYNGTLLVKGTDYTITYKNNKAVGKATVTIKGIGKCSGMVSKSFKILPKGTAISKLAKAKKAFTIKWKKQRTQTTGYQIQYSLKKSFKSGKKTVTIKNNKTIKKKIKKLKAKKKYYVRIRAYKTAKGKNYYSSWSKIKAVKTK